MLKSDKHPRVAVIILNWNGWKDTVECLESLYNINYPNYDVVLVDNASSDDSIQKIEKYCKGNLKVESKFLTFQTGNKPIKIVEHTEDEIKNLNPEEHQDTFPANRRFEENFKPDKKSLQPWICRWKQHRNRIRFKNFKPGLPTSFKQ